MWIFSHRKSGGMCRKDRNHRLLDSKVGIFRFVSVLVEVFVLVRFGYIFCFLFVWGG